VQGILSGALKVAVSQPPEDGKANAALVELLKDYFRLKRSQVELVSGATSRNKLFLLRDCNSEYVLSKIEGLE
jgi:uncharacterized protein (TIGR00251 family)